MLDRLHSDRVTIFTGIQELYMMTDSKRIRIVSSFRKNSIPAEYAIPSFSLLSGKNSPIPYEYVVSMKINDCVERARVA